MAGHSKWKNVLHKKNKTDAQRGSLFTKLGRELAVAVKSGGPDPNSNFKLAEVIAKARSNNMPNDTIARSIKKAAGDGDGVNYESVMYEGYGFGVAIIVDALTDNRNRTAADMRHYFDKYGGNLGTSGSCAYMFERKGSIIIERGDIDEEEIMEYALEAGADDIVTSDECYEVLTAIEAFNGVRDAIGKKYTIAEAELTYIADTTISLGDEDEQKLDKLVEMLESLDDVQGVYTNAE